jgi:Cu+-exporting ATPase
MEKDPVCGMTVKSGEAAGHILYQGKNYYFCSVACKDRFDRGPQPFLVKKTVEGETVGQVKES